MTIRAQSAEITVTAGKFPDISLTEIVDTSHLYVLCQRGSGSFVMDGKEFHIFPENIVMFPIGARVGSARFSEDFSGLTMTASRDFLLRNNPDPMWATKGYVFIKEYPVIQLDLASSETLANVMGQIGRELAKDGQMFRRQVIGHLYQIFLYEIWNICASQIQRRDHVSTSSAKMFADFLELVQKNAAEHRDVGYYSERLCVTPKYLSEVVKRCGGRPASYWINGYATQAIAEMLRNPEVSISEIAYNLKFFNPPHFSRFVKRTLGMTPTEYRNSLSLKYKV